MRRGTTPTHIFTVPFDTSMVSKVRVVYSQDTTPVIVKETEDCTLKGNEISVKLSQEDTLAFDYSKFVNIQIRVLTLGNDALTSDVIMIPIGRCLDDEVLR